MNVNVAFIRVIKTWLVGVVTYWICKKVFPEKKLVEPIFLDPPVSDNITPIPRGGNFLKEVGKRSPSTVKKLRISRVFRSIYR